MNYNDYSEAGMVVIPLHGVTNGRCDCGDPDCSNQYKHPRMSNWQHTGQWEDVQLSYMGGAGWLSPSFGVLVRGFIVIDADKRNGGNESLRQLSADLGVDLLATDTLRVMTGGGGYHVYFTAPEGVRLASHLAKYPGIDFKVSGFVVGCGSLHKSGARYEAIGGHPTEIAPSPQALVDLLRQQERCSSSYGAAAEADEIRDMLSAIDPDLTYDDWVRVGMACHHELGAAGFEVWDAWSQRGSKYKAEVMDRHWHSFGKSMRPVTAGTIHKLATDAGWRPPMSAEPAGLPWGQPAQATGYDLADLLRKPDPIDWPPGFAGELCRWVDECQCRTERRELVKGAVLAALGNIGGLRFEDADFGFDANQIAFFVAASSTGKEAVQQAMVEIYRAAGIQSAVHGAVKSTQEMYRNLLLNQSCIYQIDEAGYLISKLKNAAKSGASYLEGVIAELLSLYTKASAFALISGDLRTSVKDGLLKELAAAQKRVDENADSNGHHARTADRLKRRLLSIDSGLERPFLSFQGYTTPVTFDSSLDYEQATNGLMARAFFWREPCDVPAKKRRFIKSPLPDGLALRLADIAQGGYAPAFEDGIVEWLGRPRVAVHTTDDAAELMDRIDDHFQAFAERHVEASGLQSIYLRGLERVGKLSLALAIADGGVRTVEHVQWSFRQVVGMIAPFLHQALANMTQDARNGDQRRTHVISYVLSQLSQQVGQTVNALHVKRRAISKAEIQQVLTEMEQAGKARKEIKKHSVNGSDIEKWFAA